MPELLHIKRGPLTENIIRGDIVVLDRKGQISWELGDGQKTTYMRSAAKPIQAAAALGRGIGENFRLNQEEIAVMCSSHNGEEQHMAAVASILEKIGLNEEDLQLMPEHSYNAGRRDELLALGMPKRKLAHNCSGKHSAMLALCMQEGWGREDYFLPRHPVQRLISKNLADYAQMEEEALIIGVDGCGVPVFGLPLYNMALAYLNLLNPENLLDRQRQAAQSIVAAMGAHPEMIAGTGEFCTALIGATAGRLIAKKGADGIYCCAQKDGPSIALKIEDGNMAALPQVLLGVLSQLGLLSPREEEQLSPFSKRELKDCRGQIIGESKLAFSL